MPDTPKYTDEHLDRFFSGIMSLVPLESNYPLWFSQAVILADIEDGYARVMGMDFSAKVKSRYAELRLALGSVRGGLDEGTGPATEKCLRGYVKKCLEEIDKCTGNQEVIVKLWEGKQAKGERRSQYPKFMAELDKHSEWLNRVPRGEGEGWEYSYMDIIEALPNDISMPTKNGLWRIRTNRLQEKSNKT